MQCDTYYTIDIYGMVGKNMEGSLSEEYSLGVLPREFWVVKPLRKLMRFMPCRVYSKICIAI